MTQTRKRSASSPSPKRAKLSASPSVSVPAPTPIPPTFVYVDTDTTYTVQRRQCRVIPLHENSPLYQKWRPISHLIFYKTMGISNASESIMSETWVPCFGIVTQDNADFFGSFPILKNDNGETVPLPVGYILKMSAFYQYYNSLHKGFFFTQEITDLFVRFIRSGATEWRTQKNWFTDTVLKVHTYFSEIEQIQTSILLSPQSPLWLNNPQLVEFIQSFDLPLTAATTAQTEDRPLPEYGEMALASLMQTLHYTPDNFRAIADRMTFASQSDILGERQKVLMEERKKAAINRIVKK